jgi:hypothetical protein
VYNYNSVLDQTVRSGLAFSQTGPDCSLRAPDRTVHSFYQSLFSSGRKIGLNGLVQYFWDRTAVQRCWTIRSNFFKWSLKKSTVWTRPDRGQSTSTSTELASVDNVLQLYFTKVEVHERNSTKLAALNQPAKKISAHHTSQKAAKVSEEEANNLSAKIYMCIGAKVMLTTVSL